MLMTFVVLIILGMGLGVMLYWPMINIVETGKTPEYPDIQPLSLPFSPPIVLDAILHAVHALPNWAIISYDKDRGEVRAEATTSLFRFVDDVEIRVQSKAEGKQGVLVEVRSASRVGKGDFGQNARNIRKLFEEIKRQLDSTHNQHAAG